MTTVPLPTGDPDRATPGATVTVTVPAPDGTPDHGIGPAAEEAVTLREASDATGASVSAMRKAIRAGRLKSTVAEGANGPEHRVTLSAVREALPKATASRVVVVDGASSAVKVKGDDDLGRVLERLVAYSHEAGERAARAEAQRDHFRHELAQARLELTRVRQELRALPAASADTVSEPEPPPGMVMVKRRWWHRRD